MVAERLAPHDLLIRERSAEFEVEVIITGRHPFKASEENIRTQCLPQESQLFHTYSSWVAVAEMSRGVYRQPIRQRTARISAALE